MTEKEFVSLLGEQARADMAKTGILASLTTAQGILESGYGTKEWCGIKKVDSLFSRIS